MHPFRALTPVFAAVTLAAILVAPTAAAAQAPAAKPAGQTVVIESQPAEEVRQALTELLRRYPPSLGRILKTDPGLMQNAQYMAPYPQITQFLQTHPEIARNPGYYLGEVSNDYYDSWMRTPEGQHQQAINAWRDIISGFLFLIGFTAVVGAITWIIRSIVDHRRWARMSKVQAEVHNKLIDRLASNDEMLAYIQSPAGGEFLKMGPAAVGTGQATKAMHAPFGRILWSAQAGVVLFALGLGLRWVTPAAPNEVIEMLHFFGIIGQALGLGFLVSSGLSYLLSRRMGLIEPQTTGSRAGERDTPSHPSL